MFFFIAVAPIFESSGQVRHPITFSQDLSNSRWEEISFLKAGSFARGEGRRARQPGSRLQCTQKRPQADPALGS